MRKSLALVATTLLFAGSAYGQTSGHDMPGMATGAAGSAAEGSMMSAMDKMNRDMAAVPMTGNADHDFVAMMIPHHQGAVDMARFELAHGTDPALRRLAQAIVGAQEKEIAQMRRWQAQHPVQQSAR